MGTIAEHNWLLAITKIRNAFVDMKVLMISHMYPSTANEVAGIFVHEQTKALLSKDIEVRVVSSVPWAPFPINLFTHKWRAYSRIPQNCDWDGVKVFYPRYVAFPRAWFFETSGRRMYWGIRETIEKVYRAFSFDLIHAHVALPDGYAAALMAEDFGKPLVITVHGQDLQQTVLRSSVCRRALAFALRTGPRVMVVSAKLRNLATYHFGIADKLCVIPNGVDPQQIAVAGDGKDAPANGDNVLLSVSNLVESKGIDLNIYAVERLKDKYPRLLYWVVGSGPVEKKLRSLAASLGLKGRVTFFGRQTHENVLKSMASCTVFSLPSWNEGFGVVYMEAMALGKPVVGCQGEGVEDFIEHRNTGLLVKPRDVDSLVRALDFVLSNPGEASAIGEQARKVVLQSYTWDKNAEKTIEVYQQVLNEY